MIYFPPKKDITFSTTQGNFPTPHNRITIVLFPIFCAPKSEVNNTISIAPNYGWTLLRGMHGTQQDDVDTHPTLRTIWLEASPHSTGRQQASHEPIQPSDPPSLDHRCSLVTGFIVGIVKGNTVAVALDVLNYCAPGAEVVKLLQSTCCNKRWW